MSRRKVIVAGAGPAGLATAWLAAIANFDVTVFDPNPQQAAGHVAGIDSLPGK